MKDRAQEGHGPANQKPARHPVPVFFVLPSPRHCLQTGRQALHFFVTAAWAAARRAIGTRNGEQLT